MKKKLNTNLPTHLDMSRVTANKSFVKNGLIEIPFDVFANTADPDQGLLCLLLKYDMSDPTLMDK